MAASGDRPRSAGGNGGNGGVPGEILWKWSVFSWGSRGNIMFFFHGFLPCIFDRMIFESGEIANFLLEWIRNSSISFPILMRQSSDEISMKLNFPCVNEPNTGCCHYQR